MKPHKREGLDYETLLTLAADLGFGLLESGAEIYRVEESIQRLLHAYGMEQTDPFVIPNCIIVSFRTPEGLSMTRVRRMPSHGTDIDLLERYNDLCRTLCRETPPLPEAARRLRRIGQTRKEYSLPMLLVAYALGTCSFTLFFGGLLPDAICGAICGLAIGLAVTMMTWLKTNLFLKTMIGAALSGMIALGLTAAGLGLDSEKIIIGALMALVPGLIFTNAIRDIMAGDMVAGIIKVADALLTGVSIALGTAFALWLARLLWGSTAMGIRLDALEGYFLPLLYTFLACLGFAMTFNIHGTGIWICALGSVLSWFTYLVSAPLLQSEITQSFAAAVVVTIYAEAMSRIRKCPSTGYLLVACFPLVPGGGIYYTMEHAINGEVSLFLASFLHTMGIAGALAVGVLLVSSLVRMWTSFRHRVSLQPSKKGRKQGNHP